MREPAVVTAIERQFHFGARRHRTKEQGRVEHLDVDFERVHMRQASGDIGHVAGIFGDVEPEVGVGDDPVVDAPELDAVLFRYQDFRGEAPLFVQHELPGLLGFDDMSVGVDNSHCDLPPRRFGHRWNSCKAGDGKLSNESYA